MSIFFDDGFIALQLQLQLLLKESDEDLYPCLKIDFICRKSLCHESRDKLVKGQ